MSNSVVERNGSSSVIKGLEQVTLIENSESLQDAQARVKDSKKSSKPARKLIESSSIQEIFADKYKCVLRYEGHNVFIMQSKGSEQRLLGVMTDKGIERNTAIAASTRILDLVAIANRKFSPVSKVEAEEKKLKQMNEARAEIAALFGK